MADEKYISIEYNIWESKYKPLEAENERLRNELEKSKVSVEIVLKSQYHALGYPLGYVGVVVDAPELLTVKFPNIESILTKEIMARTKSISQFGTFLSKEELEFQVKRLTDAQILNHESVDRYLATVKRIPKIVKWIFRIK